VKQIRKRLTYANVMSSIAVFFVLSGATAFAATKIGANEIKANSIKTGKIVKEAVTEGKIKTGAVTTTKIADKAITGAKLDLTALGTVPNATHAVNAQNAVNATNAANAQKVGGKSLNDIVMWAFVASNGTLTRSSGGVTSTSVGTGAYKVTFPRAVNTCAYTTTSAANDGVTPAVGQTAVGLANGESNTVRVATATSAGAAVNDQFMVQVTC
jgi:hypothetical protein